MPAKYSASTLEMDHMSFRQGLRWFSEPNLFAAELTSHEAVLAGEIAAVPQRRIAPAEPALSGPASRSYSTRRL